MSELEEEASMGQDENIDDLDNYFYFVEASDASYHNAGTGNHHLPGHSSNFQGDMQEEANSRRDEEVSGETASQPEDWLLLLQLDTELDKGLLWGHQGMLYFWIRREELAARDFSRCWFRIQCM